MSLDTRIREHLQQTGEILPSRPADLSGVVARGKRRKSLRHSTLAATIAVVVAGAALLLQRPDAQPPVVTDPTTTSVANGWVAYAVEPSIQSGDIWMVKQGQEPRPMIGEAVDGVRQVCPSFSPDGTMLAYGESDFSPRQTRTLVIVSVDEAGSVLETVTRIPAPVFDGDVCAKWSPDGHKLAYRAPGGMTVVSLDGVEKTVAPPDRFGGWDLSGDFGWSPDSSQIAAINLLAAEAIDDYWGIWLLPVDGTEPALLTVQPSVNPYIDGFRDLSWAPDGSELAVSFVVASGPQGEWSEWVGRIEAQPLSEVTEVTPGRAATWSPDGAWIAYSGPTLPHPASDRLTRPTHALTEGEPTELRLLDTESRLSHSIPSFTGDGSELVWAPDSSRVVFKESVSASDYALTTTSIAEGSTPLALTPPSGDLYWGLRPSGQNISWQPIYPVEGPGVTAAAAGAFTAGYVDLPGLEGSPCRLFEGADVEGVTPAYDSEIDGWEVCHGSSDFWQSPHLLFRNERISFAAARDLVEREGDGIDLSMQIEPPTWSVIGGAVWDPDVAIAPVGNPSRPVLWAAIAHQRPDPDGSGRGRFYIVAVLADPYLFMITGNRADETVRLADHVAAQMGLSLEQVADLP